MLLIYNQTQMVMRRILDIKVFVSKCFATDVTCITQRPIQSGCALRARDGMAGIGGSRSPPLNTQARVMRCDLLRRASGGR